MKQIISALLISLPCVLTIVIAIFQFYFAFSNKIPKEVFFKTRKKLATIRWILNLITIIVLIILGLYEITLICAILMLQTTGIDIIFYLLEKIITEKKR